MRGVQNSTLRNKYYTCIECMSCVSYFDTCHLCTGIRTVAITDRTKTQVRTWTVVLNNVPMNLKFHRIICYFGTEHR